MKHTFLVMTSFTFVLALNAADVIQVTDEKEFPYIKPIAIEYITQAKIQKVPVAVEVIMDTDKDGVVDELDECPDTIEGTPVDDRGCELDSDEDGVVDSKDQCPDTSKEFKVDGYGCPQSAVLQVHFPTYGYAVSDEVIDQVKTFAKFLEENTGYNAIVSGHTDSSGDESKNQILSQNRADSVKAALTRYGIDENRLTSVGMASRSPVADNATVDGRAQNRRIEVELIKNK